MPLEYSYKVELQRLRIEILALEKNILENSSNNRAKDLLEEKKKEASWFEERIKKGKDPGVRIL